MTSEQQLQDQAKGRLFLYGPLEPRDDLDERLERCHRDLSNSVSRLREVEIYNHLNDKVNQSQEAHEDTNLALLFSILTDPNTASKQYHTLTLVNRDSFSLIISYTEKMMMEKTSKLQETTRIQLLWLTREVVQTGVAGADKLCFALLKQLPAGSTSNGDLYIAENLMHIFLDNRDWLDSQAGLISSVVYTYLSLIPCHSSPSLTNLRDQEVQMCVSLVRARFNECCQIGRDLVRLLQAVAKIPEFTELWKDILHHPQNVSPQCTGLAQLLSRRTSRRFIGGRVLVEVEIKLNFLLAKVKFGQHRRYQEWFQKKYLSSPESHHLIPELIRFICCVIHPTNEVLASDIIPRWALIGWLISLCQSNPLALANAKLALFYDWLSYSPDHDNIMNIEPGILLMHHSLRAHPQVTASLLDFLCRMVSNFCPSQPQLADVGIKAALHDILNKNVLLSLDPIFESPRIDEDLRALVKANFPEFFQPLPPPTSDGSSSMEVLEIAAGGGGQGGGGVSKGSGSGLDDPMEDYLQGEDSEIISAFSDPEDMEEMEPDEGEGDGPASERDAEGRSHDPWSRVGELPSALGDKLLELKAEKKEDNRTELMDELLDLLESLTDNEDFEPGSSVSSLLAPPLASLVGGELEQLCQEEGEEKISKNKPRLSDLLFKRLSLPTPPSSSVTLSWQLRDHQPRLGYSFLHYLHRNHTPSSSHSSSVAAEEQECFRVYRTWASTSDHGSFREILMKDLECCMESEAELFFKLLPVLCKQPKLSSEVVGNHQLISVIVTHIDPTQLNVLMYQLLNKEFQLFGRQASDIHTILIESLQWESFEQFCVWQLLNAEGPEPNLVIPSLADMNTKDHPEAISSALLFLKNESSGYSSIASLLSLPISHAPLVEVIGGRWVSGRPTKCAKILSVHLEGLEKSLADKYPTAEVTLILGHLQKIIQILNSKQILEASESALCKTLSKQFKTYPQLASSFSDLSKLVSSLSQPGDASASRKPQEKPSKHPTSSEPKPKRRRVANRDDILVIDP